MFQDELHQHYTETRRHWHAYSERYTGADSLLTLLKVGGQMLGQTVFCQHFPLPGLRSIRIFHIYVRLNGTIQHMQVIDTPYLHRLLRIFKMKVHRLERSVSYPLLMLSFERSRQKIA